MSIVRLAAIALIAAPFVATPAAAAPLTVVPIAPGECGALVKADFTQVEDAPTRVISAKVVDAAGATPAYCHVVGYVTPQVGFDLKLPMTGWKNTSRPPGTAPVSQRSGARCRGHR